MKSQKLTAEIMRYLAYVKSQVEIANSLNLTDVNKHAEDFYCGFLNIIYGYDLKNINIETPNAAAIDLGDKNRRIAIQVTATKSLKKIRETYDSFIKKKLDKTYDRLIVLNIGKERKHQAKTIGDVQTVQLDLDKDIWDVTTLMKDIRAKEIQDMEGILNFLQAHIKLPSSENQNVEKEKEHDTKVFNASQAVCSSEEFEEFFYDLLNNHSYYMDEYSRLREYALFFKKAENEFLNDEIKTHALALSVNISALQRWMFSAFHIFPRAQLGGNCRLCLHPQWNCDRDGDGNAEDSQKYNTAGEELDALATSAEEAQKSFRLCIKRNLYI